MTVRGAQAAVVREATAGDAALIAEIHNETILAQDATMETEPRTAAQVGAWMAGLGAREALLVIEHEGVVAGWGVVKQYSERPGYWGAAETSVYLRRSLRGRGLGSALKREVIARARALGYHHLVARVLADNEASVAYNLRLGYELVGVQRQVGVVGGRWRDVVILQLLLHDQPPAP